MSITNASSFARYLPHTVLRSIAANGLPPCPSAESFRGAILFADVSGYTVLAERLATRSGAGAEELSLLLNAHFGALVSLVEQHGGDVLKFAGDAFLAFWPDPPDDPSVSVRRASHCAFTMQTTLASVEAGGELELRIGVAAGAVVLMHLGSIEGHREILVAGAAMVQLASIESSIRSRDVVLTNPAWARLQGHARGTPLQNGAVRLERVDAVESLPLPPPDLTDVSGMDELLRPYVPANILPRLIAGHTAWLAELRRVTVLFIKLPGLSQMVSPHVAQALLSSIQGAVLRYEGSINNISSDDKGVSILVIFGLPPLAHEDDAVRATNAALAVEDALQEQGLLGAMGLATGQAFCGLLGNAVRLQYAVLGDVVNRASRLMTASSSGALCDGPTYHAAGERFGFETYPAIRVKGRTELMEVYRPFRSQGTKRGGGVPLVGRAEEQRILWERLTRLKEENRGGLVLLEGDAGIGKSRLVQYLDDRGRKMEIRVVRAAAEAIDAATPYHAWRSVFSQLLDFDALPNNAEIRKNALVDQLSADAAVLQFAPLLNPLLGLDIAETEVTRQMDAEIRARKTQSLLLQILDRAMKEPILLLLEDAHWFDSASWQLTRLVSQRIRSALIVITSRSGASSGEPGFFEHSSGVVHLRLRPLSRTETEQLIAHRTGGQVVPEQIVDFIFARAEGNPFFSEELILALDEAGLLHRAAEPAGSEIGDVQLRSVALPESLQGVIVSRIDRLPPAPQLCLKVASVIGRYFSIATLRSIYPIQEDASRLEQHLEHLRGRGLIQLDHAGPRAVYRFQHAVTQEATYGLLPLAQRHLLHRAVAEWYEAEHASDLAPVYPILVHHWRGAAVDEATGRYLDLASDQALASGAYREAIDFFQEAQQRPGEALDQQSGTAGRLRWAMRERKIGEAYYGLGRLTESHRHLERAIAVLDRPLPRTTGSLLARVALEATLQVGHRLGLGKHRDENRSTMLAVEACLAYERLAELGFFLGESLRILYDVLRNLNLAEAAGVPAQAARSYAHMGTFLDLIHLRPAARRYERMALDVAESVDQIGARALVYEAIGLSSVGLAEWDKAHDYLIRGADLFHQSGHRRKWEECLSLSIVPALLHRMDFDYVERVGKELVASASQSGDPQTKRWALYDGARLAMVKGRFGDALVAIEAAIALLPGSVDPSDEIRFFGLESLIRLRLGQVEEAHAAASKGVDRVRATRSLAYYAYEGFEDLAETCLTLGATRDPRVPSDAATLRRWAGTACTALRRHARLFPIAEPAAGRMQGLAEWDRGHRRRAARAWRKSLAAAERLAMPHARGLAHLEIGSHLPTTSAERVDHLKRACRIFERIGDEFYLASARASLAGRGAESPGAAPGPIAASTKSGEPSRGDGATEPKEPSLLD